MIFSPRGNSIFFLPSLNLNIKKKANAEINNRVCKKKKKSSTRYSSFTYENWPEFLDCSIKNSLRLQKNWKKSAEASVVTVVKYSTVENINTVSKLSIE